MQIFHRIHRSSTYRPLAAMAGVALLVALSGCAPDSRGEQKLAATPLSAPSVLAHWSYAGSDGPEHWGDLDTSYATCETGRQQSPINLVGTTTLDARKEITVDYKPSRVQLENNGHTIQVNVPSGSSIRINGTSYGLQQFHLHLPSEHTVQGKGAAMELHFVHKNEQGKLAVLGVLMQEKSGPSAFRTLWKSLPAKQGERISTVRSIDLNEFLPVNRRQFRYVGSLTTPPCSEGVLWNVLREPIRISYNEVAQYRTLFPKSNRPIQKLNEREIFLTDKCGCWESH